MKTNSLAASVASTNENDATSRSDSGFVDAEPANVTWFRSRDFDKTGAISLAELMVGYQSNSWYNQRYRTAMDRFVSVADSNGDRVIDMDEYLR